MSEIEKGVYLAVFKKEHRIVKNGNIPANNLAVNWEMLKADLEELSGPQLKLVLELVEHIGKVNKEDLEKVPSESVHFPRSKTTF